MKGPESLMNTLFQSRISFWAFLCTGNKNKQTKYLVILFVLIDNIFNVVAFAFTELFGKQGRRKHLKLFRVLRKTSDLRERKQMKVLEIISPVLVMIILGILCRKWKLLNKNGIDSMKALVTNIMLPVAIFHALATSDYGAETAKLVGIMFIMLVVSFGIGFLMKPLMTENYRKYLPFMVSVYEGGSMAYPLYTSLCGQDNLSQIAVLDIAGLLFGFSIYMGMLGQTENGEKINVNNLAVSAVKTPAFIASVLGIIAGLTGVLKLLLASPAGGIYTSVESILTTALTAIILIVVGFSMELTPELFGPCVRTIVMRIVLQAVMIVCVLLAVHSFIGSNKLLDLAVITYMSAPATFSMQTFLKREDGSAYVSTTNSLYCIVSVVVYMILAFFTY